MEQDIIEYLSKLWIDEEVNNNPVLLTPVFNFDNNKIVIDIKIDNLTDNIDIEQDMKELVNMNTQNVYTGEVEAIVNLTKKSVKKRDIRIVKKYEKSDIKTKINILKSFNNCIIYKKYKNGDILEPKNYRYFSNHHITIKLIDRIWCKILLNNLQKLPNSEIIKYNFKKDFCENLIDVATKNTQDKNSIILLDLTRAFDSVKWMTIYKLLFNNLKYLKYNLNNIIHF
jgi:hypothetical protein